MRGMSASLIVFYLSAILIHSSVCNSYRLVPTFGRGVIRRFVKNTSAMKKLAARDWEDMLQVAIPVFDGLLDEPYNSIVLDMLFLLASWHALAKLRMHTDTTLSVFEKTTADLGTAVRGFAAKVCSTFVTRELPREEAARGRRTAAKATQSKNGKGKTQARNQQTQVESGEDGGPTKSGPKIKTFSLSTYKWHALGDYGKMVRAFGTTDSYSTQTVNPISRDPPYKYTYA